MRLAGSQIEQLQKALLSAFPTYNALAQMVRFKLDEDLESIAGQGKQNEVVFNLIQWAESRNRIAEMATKAFQMVPGNPALGEFVVRIGFDLQPSTDSISERQAMKEENASASKTSADPPQTSIKVKKIEGDFVFGNKTVIHESPPARKRDRREAQ